MQLVPFGLLLLALLFSASAKSDVVHGQVGASMRQLSQNTAWPSYDRGKDKYEFVLSPRDLANSLSYYGSAERLRIAIDKMKKGEVLYAAAIGYLVSHTGIMAYVSWRRSTTK
eukprot:gene32026-16551_t